MMKRHSVIRISFAALVFGLCCLHGTVFAAWQDDLDSLYVAETPSSAQHYIDRIVASGAAWKEVYDEVGAIAFPDRPADSLILDSVMCEDGVRRPYIVCVPPIYGNGKATPLLVVLHGGVARPEIRDNPRQYAQDHPFTKMARQNGWLALYPFGQEGATWFDPVGMSNIKNLVRVVKSGYNVDDDRVWMGGFSDGASASYGHAMLDPSDYAAFVALNGDMGVTSYDGKIPTYPVNLANSPVYAISTDQDALYPSSQMRKAVRMALDAGARILYKEREGEHRFSYADQEIPIISEFLARHERDPFPARIVWESPGGRFGHCFWLAIDSASSEPPEPWHGEYNVDIIDSSITIGFIPDDTYKGEGVLVGGLANGDYIAARIGLKKSDIIVEGNGLHIANFDDLKSFKSRLSYGEPVTIKVLRNGKKIELKGTLPEPSTSPLFLMPDFPSARIEAIYYGNIVEIEASRLKSFRIFVNPDMFNIERNLMVRVNGKTVYDRQIVPDLTYLLRNFWYNLDRKLVYIAEVKINL